MTPTDETGVNPARLPRQDAGREDAAILAACSDEQVIEWDGNFRDDGALFLICSDRDIEIAEYRKVLEEYVRYRDRGVAPGESGAELGSRWVPEKGNRRSTLYFAVQVGKWRCRGVVS